MANENKEKLVKKPGKRKPALEKRKIQTQTVILFMLPYALMFVDIHITSDSVGGCTFIHKLFNAIQFPLVCGFFELHYTTYYE